MFSLQYLQCSAFRDIEVAIDFSFNWVGEPLRAPWVSILSPTNIDSGAYCMGCPTMHNCTAVKASHQLAGPAETPMADHLSKKKNRNPKTQPGNAHAQETSD